MFGIDVERYCIKCKKSISFKNISVGYTVFDKNNSKAYFTDLKCPYCNSDLSKKDRLELEKARKENKLVVITMF